MTEATYLLTSLKIMVVSTHEDKRVGAILASSKLDFEESKGSTGLQSLREIPAIVPLLMRRPVNANVFF